MRSLTTGLHDISNTLTNYLYTTKQSFAVVAENARDLRNNTEVFQKVCQIGFAILHYIQETNHTDVLSRLTVTLSTANLHDFYSFLKRPYNWFFPIHAEKIDAEAVLNSLKQQFSLRIFTLNFSDLLDSQKEDIHRITTDFLKAHLKSMNDNGDSFPTTDEFLIVLQRRIRAARTIAVHAHHNEYNKYIDIEDEDIEDEDIEDEDIEDEYIAIREIDIREINIMRTTVTLKKTSLLDKLTNLVWLSVDVACVELYLKGWNLLDTAKWAGSIGQHSVFNWVRNTNLETFVQAAVSGAFALKFIEAVRKFQDDELSPQMKLRAKWDAITAAAELVFQGAGYLRHIGKIDVSLKFLTLACIVAKGVGIYSIARRPQRDFLEVAGAAA